MHDCLTDFTHDLCIRAWEIIFLTFPFSCFGFSVLVLVRCMLAHCHFHGLRGHLKTTYLRPALITEYRRYAYMKLRPTMESTTFLHQLNVACPKRGCANLRCGSDSSHSYCHRKETWNPKWCRLCVFPQKQIFSLYNTGRMIQSWHQPSVCLMFQLLSNTWPTLWDNLYTVYAIYELGCHVWIIHRESRADPSGPWAIQGPPKDTILFLKPNRE